MKGARRSVTDACLDGDRDRVAGCCSSAGASRLLGSLVVTPRSPFTPPSVDRR